MRFVFLYFEGIHAVLTDYLDLAALGHEVGLPLLLGKLLVTTH